MQQINRYILRLLCGAVFSIFTISAQHAKVSIKLIGDAIVYDQEIRSFSFFRSIPDSRDPLRDPVQLKGTLRIYLDGLLYETSDTSISEGIVTVNFKDYPAGQCHLVKL